MCDVGLERPGTYHERWHVARKEHRCCSCGEGIEPGHRYHYTFGVWDGDVSTYRHCARCWAMFDAIVAQTEPGELVDMQLACGTSWQDAFGSDPPAEVAALAFALPGEVVT